MIATGVTQIGSHKLHDLCIQVVAVVRFQGNRILVAVRRGVKGLQTRRVVINVVAAVFIVEIAGN